ncbi:hypothetical protein HQ535_15165 [bacterium]|nr:hypothetical protein [bacterium]
MTGSTTEIAATLAGAFVGAFESHVVARVEEMGIDSRTVAGAVSEGRSWLAGSLKALLSGPFESQTRSPLEVFQEAMRFPTAALEEAGIPPLSRDPVSEAALPGDLYGLAPASSRDLGDEVWQAHLAWGVAKAAALTRPSAGVLSSNLMDRSRIESAISESGYRSIVLRDLGESAARYPAVAFVDVTHDDADEAVRDLSAAGVRVIVFGPHVDDFALIRAKSLGAHDALARSQFFRMIGELLPPLV